MKVKFCKDCKWSRKDKKYSDIRCIHDDIVSHDQWALSRPDYENDFMFGSCCSTERSKKWFGKCGMKGKLWEPKEVEND